jgi:carboxyl-terminal processing protease
MDGVAANVEIPSLTDAMDVGERFLDHPLPHDRIRPAGDFKPMEPQALFIPRLKELSQERLNADKDFSYVIQDILKAKERVKANRVALNKAAREKELIASDLLQKERNAERRARFAKISDSDKKTMTFFKITLEDLEKGADLKPYNPADDGGGYMRRAIDETAELDQTPKWPTGLDPVKRESLAVLKDLVDLTENARLAGMLKGTAEVR